MTPYEYGYFYYLYLSIIFYNFSNVILHHMVLHRADILFKNLYFFVAYVGQPKSIVT